MFIGDLSCSFLNFSFPGTWKTVFQIVVLAITYAYGMQFSKWMSVGGGEGGNLPPCISCGWSGEATTRAKQVMERWYLVRFQKNPWQLWIIFWTWSGEEIFIKCSPVMLIISGSNPNEARMSSPLTAYHKDCWYTQRNWNVWYLCLPLLGTWWSWPKHDGDNMQFQQNCICPSNRADDHAYCLHHV